MIRLFGLLGLEAVLLAATSARVEDPSPPGRG
jgi:hypothetical protein